MQEGGSRASEAEAYATHKHKQTVKIRGCRGARDGEAAREG